MSDFVDIHLLNWDSHQARKDVKHPGWFKFDHTIFENSDFFNFKREELCFYFYLLSQASKHNNSKFKLCISHAVRVAGFSKASIKSCIEKLKLIQELPVDVTDAVRARYVDGTDTCSRIDKIREEEKREEEIRAVFDFEFLYQKFPRKQGKKEGLARCVASIKTKEDYEKLSLAIDQFNSFHAKKGTSEEYLPYFSSFMNDWESWLEKGGLPKTSSQKPTGFSPQDLLAQEEAAKRKCYHLPPENLKELIKVGLSGQPKLEC